MLNDDVNTNPISSIGPPVEKEPAFNTVHKVHSGNIKDIRSISSNSSTDARSASKQIDSG
jgi:hypothetical protein